MQDPVVVKDRVFFACMSAAAQRACHSSHRVMQDFAHFSVILDSRWSLHELVQTRKSASH